MERCCGLKKKGGRCKIHTLDTGQTYGIDMPACRFHRTQNMIFEWSVCDSEEVPPQVRRYLRLYYGLSEQLTHMRDVSRVMLTSFLYKQNDKFKIDDVYEHRNDFYANIFREAHTAGESECPICFEDAEVITECRHPFCKSCIYQWCDKSGTCPMCRSQFFKIF